MDELTASPAFLDPSTRILVHATYDEDETAKAYFKNHEFDSAGNPNPYYDQACEDEYDAADDDDLFPENYCAPEGCTDLLQCTLNENDNKVYSILLGSALNPQLAGTTDDTYYTHYSVLATLQANWGLGTLGRNDETAPPFRMTPTSGATMSTVTDSGATSSNGNSALVASWWVGIVPGIALVVLLVECIILL